MASDPQQRCFPNPGRWQWSGGFALAAKEAYFGLRVRHAQDPSHAVNIPVNTTVGPSGTRLLQSSAAGPGHSGACGSGAHPPRRWLHTAVQSQSRYRAVFKLCTYQAADSCPQVGVLPVCDAGTVLITFKSRLSLPPYRIENATSDVAIWFAQVRVSALKTKPLSLTSLQRHAKATRLSTLVIWEVQCSIPTQQRHWHRKLRVPTGCRTSSRAAMPTGTG